MQTVQDIREQFLEKFIKKDFVGNTLEIIGATFIADEPEIFGGPNPEWYEREMEWYRSISLNVRDIKGNIPAIWTQVATPDGYINSNYGWCLWSEENGFQYKHVLEKLKSDKNSRQGQLVFQRPAIHTEWNAGGMRDFICTAYIQMLIRDDKLVCHYVMRSNDFWAGYRGDSHFAREVHREMAKDLDIEVGNLIWTASSGHFYDRQYYLIDHYARTGEINISKSKYAELYPNSKYL